jgi:uncharacterized phage protein (TIGR02220 family)
MEVPLLRRAIGNRKGINCKSKVTMAKDTLWFKHDTNSRSDEKIIDLQMEHGMEGLGVYWCIIEMMYEQMGVMRLQCERIAFELRTHKNVVEDVLMKYDLFQIDGDIVTNRRVTEELDARCEVSEKARERADKRWEKVRLERDRKMNDADAMRTHSAGNAQAMQRREEERREEKRREEDNREEESEKKSELVAFEKKSTAMIRHEDYAAFVQMMQEVTGRPFKGCKKSQVQFSARIKDGYTLEDIRCAVTNAAADEFHRSKNFEYLTPEFITRPDKLENFTTRLPAGSLQDQSRKINRTQTVGEVTQSAARAAAMIEAKRNQIT